LFQAKRPRYLYSCYEVFFVEDFLVVVFLRLGRGSNNLITNTVSPIFIKSFSSSTVASRICLPFTYVPFDEPKSQMTKSSFSMLNLACILETLGSSKIKSPSFRPMIMPCLMGYVRPLRRPSLTQSSASVTVGGASSSVKSRSSRPPKPYSVGSSLSSMKLLGPWPPGISVGSSPLS